MATKDQQLTQQIAMAIFNDRDTVARLLLVSGGLPIEPERMRDALSDSRIVRKVREGHVVDLRWADVAGEFNSRLATLGFEKMQLAAAAMNPQPPAPAVVKPSADALQVARAIESDRDLVAKIHAQARFGAVTGPWLEQAAGGSRVVRMMREGQMVKFEWDAIAKELAHRLQLDKKADAASTARVESRQQIPSIGPSPYPRYPAPAHSEGEVVTLRPRARTRA